MPRSDPQPPDQHDTARLLHSAMAWALTGAVMTVARRPLWHGVGVVLLVLGLGVVGWVVRRRLRQQPPRQRTDAEGSRRTGGPGLERWASRHRRVPAGRAGSGGRHRPALEGARMRPSGDSVWRGAWSAAARCRPAVAVPTHSADRSTPRRPAAAASAAASAGSRRSRISALWATRGWSGRGRRVPALVVAAGGCRLGGHGEVLQVAMAMPQGWSRAPPWSSGSQ
jgi:hypothetical protein